MIDVPGKPAEQRVLVLAPTGKDAALSQAVLERASIECVCCRNLTGLFELLEAGAGAVLLAEEVLVDEGTAKLVSWLSRQPTWSDLPILILARPGADSLVLAQAMENLGNVTVLERPMQVSALVSAVKTALRARHRQCQIREHLAAQERTEAELRVNDRRKDEFLAILAHELRNPLAPIRNSLQVLQLSRFDDPLLDRIAQMMERQVNQMVRLVDDLMEVSRITRGEIELRREAVEVNTILAAAVETSRPLLQTAEINLQLSLPNEPLALDGDPVRLAQIFSNVLNNAAKYSFTGGTVWLSAAEAGDWVVVSVRDTGTGIPPEMLPRVFDMFTQIDRDVGRAKGGLGIGLTLVKTLVEMHGGTVDARSQGLGSGSEFVIRLPRDPRRSNGATQKATDSRTLASRRVLVVDDNRDAVESLSMLLRLLGADVRTAYDGPNALSLLEQFVPDVILLDLGMPGMDGLEVARRIRKQPALDEVKLIALSGWGQDADRVRSRAAGFDHHLVKPADLGSLQRMLGPAGTAA